MKPYQTKERRYINKGYSFLILQDAHSVVMLQFWWKMPETNPFWEPQTSESLRRNDAKFVIHLTYCLVFPLDFFLGLTAQADSISLPKSTNLYKQTCNILDQHFLDIRTSRKWASASIHTIPAGICDASMASFALVQGP